MSWIAGSFVAGCLVAAASGYGWFGSLITGAVAGSATIITLIAKFAMDDRYSRQTWWIEPEDEEL